MLHAQVTSAHPTTITPNRWGETACCCNGLVRHSRARVGRSGSAAPMITDWDGGEFSFPFRPAWRCGRTAFISNGVRGGGQPESPRRSSASVAGRGWPHLPHHSELRRKDLQNPAAAARKLRPQLDRFVVGVPADGTRQRSPRPPQTGGVTIEATADGIARGRPRRGREDPNIGAHGPQPGQPHNTARSSGSTGSRHGPTGSTPVTRPPPAGATTGSAQSRQQRFPLGQHRSRSRCSTTGQPVQTRE